ncbi:MAG: hypothetical protein WC621_05460 [Patescibacteria group bacterium]
MKYLTIELLSILFTIVKEEITHKGTSFYSWVNAPEVKDEKIFHTSGWGDNAQTKEISVQQAFEIYEGKLNGAYGERFAITMALLVGLIRQGKKVALLQLQKEEGTPFDATGWVVLSIEKHPAFHLAPWDLPMTKVNEAGLLNLVLENSPEAKEHGYKGTNKVQELCMLLDWSLNG